MKCRICQCQWTDKFKFFLLPMTWHDCLQAKAMNTLDLLSNLVGGGGYGGGFMGVGGVRSAVSAQFRAYSMGFLEKGDKLDDGDKVVLPPSFFERLTQADVQFPMQFSAVNPSSGVSTHCGVIEFTAEEGRVYDDDDEDANDTQVATALLVQKYLLHGTKGQILTHEDANSTQSSGTQYIARRCILVQKCSLTGTKVQILTKASAAPQTRVPCPGREGGWTLTSPISTSSCLLSRWLF